MGEEQFPRLSALTACRSLFLLDPSVSQALPSTTSHMLSTSRAVCRRAISNPPRLGAGLRDASHRLLHLAPITSATVAASPGLRSSRQDGGQVSARSLSHGSSTPNPPTPAPSPSSQTPTWPRAPRPSTQEQRSAEMPTVAQDHFRRHLSKRLSWTPRPSPQALSHPTHGAHRTSSPDMRRAGASRASAPHAFAGVKRSVRAPGHIATARYSEETPTHLLS